MMITNHELIWFLVPLCSFLWMLGGTWKKQFRRIGVPTAITLASFLFLGWSWWWLALWPAYFVVTILPFTLIGDDIHENPLNWAWIWVAGAILGIPAMVLGIVTHQVVLSVALVAVPCLVQGVFGTLSNVKATRNYFRWKSVEFAIGAAVAVPPALLIDLYNPMVAL